MSAACERRSKSQSTNAKVRSACDLCHHTKVKCSKDQPCEGCRRLGFECEYSASSRSGRPKGTKNKKTLARMQTYQATKLAKAAGTSRGHEQPERIEDVILSPNPGEPFQEIRQPAEGTATTLHATSSSYFDSPTSKYCLDDFMIAGDAPNPNGDDFMDDGMYAVDKVSASGTEAIEPFPHVESTLCSSESDVSRLFDDRPSDTSCTSNENDVCQDSGVAEARFDLAMSDVSNGFSETSTRMQDLELAIDPPALQLRVCRCLQDQATILCHLKALEKQRSSLRVDFALIGAQRALDTWRILLRCSECLPNPSGDAIEVLALLAMSTGSLLQLFQTQASSLNDQTKPSTNPSSELFAERKRLRPKIGLYHTNQDEDILVTTTVLFRAITHTKTLLQLVNDRIEELKSSTMATTRFAAAEPLPSPPSSNATDGDPTERDPVDADEAQTRIDGLNHVQATLQRLGKKAGAMELQMRGHFLVLMGSFG